MNEDDADICSVVVLLDVLGFWAILAGGLVGWWAGGLRDLNRALYVC